MKAVKKIAKIALPIIGTLVAPGIGTALSSTLSSAALSGIGGALGGAASGALSGGGLGGILKGAALGGLGGYGYGGGFDGILGSAQSALGGIQSSLGIPDFGIPQIGSAATGMSSVPSGALPSTSGSSLGMTSMPSTLPSTPGAVSGSGSLLSRLGSKITSDPIGALSAGLAINQAVGGNKVEGEQTQADVLAEMQARKEQEKKFSEETIKMLQNAQSGRSPIQPNIADYYTYGQRPEATFFNQVNTPIAYKKGGFVKGGALSGGQDDKVDAKLSNGEYVVPADVVAALGDGANDNGAKKLDKMLGNVRKHKTGRSLFPPKAKGALSYMKG